MKLVHVALLYLGSVTFFGVDAVRVDVATEFKRKWTKWALSRAKRDGSLPSPSQAHRVPSSGPPLRCSHARSLFLPSSSREDAHIRVKRYRQSINRFPHFQTNRSACRLGTCTLHWLVDELHRAAVNDRNDAAPPIRSAPRATAVGGVPCPSAAAQRALPAPGGAHGRAGSSSSPPSSESERRKTRPRPPRRMD
uniref:Pro-adrenomedullin n=1 Tax=Malurus cyaneus samueli TaxID=2593467 RepID=A0A8C5TZZ3_9PASS